MATKLIAVPKVSQRPFSPCRRRSTGVTACASRETNGRDNYGGRLVDENMIVLRLRIREMKMLETDNEANRLPSEWMEWEKQYYVHYIEDVFEGIGLLQNYLMNTRPSVALGFLALFMLSVPISSGFVLFHVLETTKQILSWLYLMTL
ncbi:mediator of RNA polymerase II transcription subunit [Trema orientale]|uniref:Mediator of RNA polymerase II transcription subunit n=1 Tax=Trema orientale TaxID=63057 RepID=A0A2P5CBY6_TREOI|nr:mediator of RNA polymerase II transcription subunit [Trema orientale]